MSRTNLFGLERAGLEAAVVALGEPAYRARQVYSWLYRKRARSFADMTDLGKGLRRRLEAEYELLWPPVEERSLSYDGTRKYLFRLEAPAGERTGPSTVESVYIPEEKRRTICISTQAGCPLKCAFCLTGIAGYKRNLRPGEILGQVATVMEDAPPRELPWNVVVMGMGEPLLNYEATVDDPKTYTRPWKLLLPLTSIALEVKRRNLR